MPRLHLFEFNDMPWLPMPLRRTLLELLHHLSTRLGLYRTGFDAVAQVVQRTGTTTVQALCAGDGGCAQALAEHLGQLLVQVVLSDKNPALESFREIERQGSGRIQSIQQPVDALAVPEELRGLRVIINAVHHFREPGVRALLSDAVAKGQPIIFLEPVQREFLSILRYTLVAPIAGMVLSLVGIWPPNARRLLLGGVVPLGTFCLVFDGIVSHLRAYRAEEWEALVKQVDGHERFDWEVRYLTGTLGSRLTFLAGTPKAQAR